MPRWHNHYLDGHAHFCTAAVKDRRPVLVDRAEQLLYPAWQVTRESLDVRMLAYVIMPDHFHLMLWSEFGRHVRTFLQRTLSRSGRAYPRPGRFWKERPRVVPVYSEAVLWTKIDYLHANPVRSGLVARAEDWAHSSYRQLAGRAGEVAFCCDTWEGLLR
jgi:putative transposase